MIKWDEARLCATKMLSQKSEIASYTFWCLCFQYRILDLLNVIIITLLCVTELVSTENQHNASVLYFYGAGRNVRCVYGSNETSWPKEHFSTFLSSLVCQTCIKICVAVQKLYIKILIVLRTCICVHYAMPNSIIAIFIWIRLFIYVVNCSFTRIGWIT